MAIIPADVTRMLRGTAGWLSAALPQFDPHRPSREVYSNFAPAKAFAELSFFCMVARRRAKGKEEPDFEAMRTFIREVVSRPRFIEGTKDPKKFLLHLNIHVAAETLGLKSPESRDVLQRLLANGYVTSRDNKNAFRLMDLRYTLDRGGFRHALPPVEQLYSRT